MQDLVSSSLEKININDLVSLLRSNNINNFYFVYDKERKKVVASHAVLDELANFIQSDQRDFQAHEGMFFHLTEKYDTLLGAFIHKTNRGQAAGGTRYWQYDDFEGFLRDGMRLSKGMTRKNALAGLWWGGGKGVMWHNPKVDKNDPEIRQYLYAAYGKLVSSIKGCYVTAEDVGTNVVDMDAVFSQTRFTTCIPFEKGGSGNPSAATARGVVAGMEAALAYNNMGDLEGKTIAVQGMGNVASFVIQYAFEKGAKKIVACDINQDLIDKRILQFKDYNFEGILVDKNDSSILFMDCDIVSPNATGGVLNPDTIPQIKAPIICGATNNQLEDTARDDKTVKAAGIIYMPDFLINRMGIVNCANEQYGYVKNDPFIEQHLKKNWTYSVYQTALRVLSRSEKYNMPTAEIAIALADDLATELHPIFGHRGAQIIDSVVNSDWHLK